MAELHSVLITAKLGEKNLQRLKEALGDAETCVCDPGDREGIAACIQRVDAAILNGDADDLILSGKNLKWIHCCHAGLDKTIRPELFERNIILTSSSGRSAPALAEHALMFMLTLTYDLPMLLAAKANHRWVLDRAYSGRTALYGKTVGLVGMGKTGTAITSLAKALHMNVVCWRRSDSKPDNVDRVYAADKGETVVPLLEQSDYVILCAALNDHTWHLINRDTLGRMKQTAYLINIGRGALIDEAALAEALREGRIAGAGLDTFETEPLPADSPLWDLDQVIITPHTTPKLPDREERSLAYVLKNIEAYRNDGAFVNRLDTRDLYTRGKPASGTAQPVPSPAPAPKEKEAGIG